MSVAATLNQSAKDSLLFSQSLMDIFKQQFGAQSGILNFLSGKLTNMIQNPTGFSSQSLAAMRTGASTNTATQFENAQKATQATMAGRGDFTGPVKSGVDAQVIGNIKGQEAGALSGQLNDISLADENLKEQNRWKAISGETDIASMENPQGYAGSANSGTNSTANAGSAAYTAEGPGFGSIAGSILGGAASGFATGGVKKLFG